MTLFKLMLMLICGLTAKSITSQNYNFTLVQNSNFNYTISAVSLYDSGSFQPITQSYGFVLVLPDGVNITVDDVQPSGTNETITAISGTNVSGIDPSMADKDLFQIITDTSGGTIAAHGNNVTIPLVTITVNGNPSSGEIRILDNSSTLASSPALNGALDAFFQIDITNDASVNFNNEFNQLDGDEVYSFETLSVETIAENLLDIGLYPNPAKDSFQLIGDISRVTKIEFFDIDGKLVFTKNQGLENISIQGLKSALYLVKLHMDKSTKTIKLLKH